MTTTTTFGKRASGTSKAQFAPRVAPLERTPRFVVRGVPAGVFFPAVLPTAGALLGYVVMAGLSATGGAGGVGFVLFAWLLFLPMGLFWSFGLTKLVGFFGDVGTTMETLTSKEGVSPLTMLAVMAAAGWLALSPPQTDGPYVLAPAYAIWLQAVFLKLAVCLSVAKLTERLRGKGAAPDEPRPSLLAALRDPGHDVFPAVEQRVAALAGGVLAFVIAMAAAVREGEGSIISAAITCVVLVPILRFVLRVATAILNRAIQAWGYVGDLA